MAAAVVFMDFPEDLAGFDRPIVGSLPVGAAGKVGVLELTLAKRGGMTRVVRQHQQAPLHVYRPIHLDESLPEMAFVFVQQFGDGFVDGDRCRIDIDCGTDTQTHVTTQAATNLYRAEHNFAAQLVTLRVGRRAVLEYLPDAVVPYRGARFYQRTSLIVDWDATAIIGEMLLPGRVARGELHEYDLYRAETEARRADGSLLFADLTLLRPTEDVGCGSFALLADSDVLATLHVVTQRLPAADLVQLIRHSAAGNDVLAGVSELPAGSGASVRVLGATSRVVRAALLDIWNAVRLELLGAPAPDLRKG
jgi:urease accessory protein